MKRYILLAILAGWMVLASATTPLYALTLDLPVDCTPGEDCIIQNYVDQAPGEAHQDFLCRKLAYDKHKGTDFRMPVMKRGNASMAVLAAAHGTVKALRDGESEALFTTERAAVIKNRECGNGVVLRHEGGWETQYCHLQKGSVAVKEGQTVQAGAMLGRIGLSGKTEFPHLHLAVRNPKGEPVDPFNGRVMESGCGERKQQLWSDTAQQAIDTSATGFLAAGAAERPVTMEAAIMGQGGADRLPVNIPALVVWSLHYGLQAGDEIYMRINAPDGSTLVEHSQSVPRFKAQYFKYVGRKEPDTGWKAGDYLTLIQVKRDGEVVSENISTVELY
jgi:hypothetical protein